MGVTVDVAYKSLNKFNEVLCGDKVNCSRRRIPTS